MTLDLFQTYPRGPIVLAEILRPGQKRVFTEHRPPNIEDFQAHLEGRLALGLIPEKAISIDFDHHEPPELRPLLDLFRELGVPAYYGPSTTRGSRVWVFFGEPSGNLEELARGLASIAQTLGLPAEYFPNGSKPTLLPLFGYYNGQPRPLYSSRTEEPVSLPFAPEYADPEHLRRVARAGELLRVALSQRPPSRHDSLLAFLNLAHRLGVLEEATVLFASEAVFDRWGIREDGSRTLEAWKDEVARAAEAARSSEYERKRGFSYLREAGYDLRPLNRIAAHLLWPEPKPLESLLNPLPLWPEGVLPDPLEDFVFRVSENLAIERTPVALGVLAVLSGVLSHKGAEVRPEPGNAAWRETPNLWLALIAPPGSGKSPLIRTVAAPLWAIERELAQENAERRKAFERELLEWKSLKAEERVEVERPEPPLERRLVVADATPEKLATLLTGNRGLMVLLDELKGLLASWHREDRAQGRALFLSAYSGEPFVVDRVMRGTEYLERPVLALLGATTPGPWHRLLEEAHRLGSEADGLLQRITPVIVELRPYREDPPEVPPEVLKAYEDFVRGLWASEDYQERVLTPTPQAYKLWRDWRADLEDQVRDETLPETWRSLVAKWKGLTARLAGVLAAAHGEVAISDRALALSVLLVKEVLEPHAKRAWRFRGADLSPAKRLAQYLLKHRPESFSLREVYRGEWGGLDRREEAQAALDLLLKAGWVVEVPAGRWPRYELNPRVQEVVGGQG